MMAWGVIEWAWAGLVVGLMVLATVLMIRNIRNSKP
jgi:hypothetical protein